jgi:hypothetical protein
MQTEFATSRKCASSVQLHGGPKLDKYCSARCEAMEDASLTCECLHPGYKGTWDVTRRGGGVALVEGECLVQARWVVRVWAGSSLGIRISRRSLRIRVEGL